MKNKNKSASGLLLFEIDDGMKKSSD